MGQTLKQALKTHMAKERFLTEVHYQYTRVYAPFERDDDIWMNIREHAEKIWDEEDDPLPANIIFEVTGR